MDNCQFAFSTNTKQRRAADPRRAPLCAASPDERQACVATLPPYWVAQRDCQVRACPVHQLTASLHLMQERGSQWSLSGPSRVHSSRQRSTWSQVLGTCESARWTSCRPSSPCSRSCASCLHKLWARTNRTEASGSRLGKKGAERRAERARDTRAARARPGRRNQARELAGEKSASAMTMHLRSSPAHPVINANGRVTDVHAGCKAGKVAMWVGQ